MRRIRLLAICAIGLGLLGTCWAAPPPRRNSAANMYNKSLRSKANQEALLRNKMKQVQGQIKASQAEIDNANQREGELGEELGLTQNQLEGFSNKLRETRTALAQAQTQLDLLQVRIKESQGVLLQSQFALERRLRAIEMQGEVSYLSVLLQSNSFSDFLNQSEFLLRLVKSDEALIDEVRSQREALEGDKLQAVRSVRAIRQLKKNYEVNVAGLDKMQTHQASTLAQLQTQRKRLESYVTELELLSVAMEKRLQRLIRERQRASSMIASTGRYMYPVRGELTSGFGYRIHPITGVTRFHSGLDLAADEGVPIRSSANGVVIFSNWYGGYGNCVIINHGGGFSTLYGHCSRLLVGEGTRVRQGQAVALVGSTGMSTGPHLHFEIRKDGTPVDPRSRL